MRNSAHIVIFAEHYENLRRQDMPFNKIICPFGPLNAELWAVIGQSESFTESVFHHLSSPSARAFFLKVNLLSIRLESPQLFCIF